VAANQQDFLSGYCQIPFITIRRVITLALQMLDLFGQWRLLLLERLNLLA
jgi:hypothetical protein